jgi:hypothetical protein
MLIVDKVDLGDGAVAEISNAMRGSARWDCFRDRFALGDEDDPGWIYRLIFLRVAAYTREVKGLKWKLPLDSATGEELEKALQAFGDAVDWNTALRWNNAIVALLKPSAPPDQVPEEALSEAERADPN